MFQFQEFAGMKIPLPPSEETMNSTPLYNRRKKSLCYIRISLFRHPERKNFLCFGSIIIHSHINSESVFIVATSIIYFFL